MRSWKAEMAGFGCHGSKQLSINSASGISLFQYDIGNLEEAVASVEIKWFFQVRMHLSARLAR